MPLDDFSRISTAHPPTALRPALHVSTRDLPAREQFAAYHAASAGIFAVEQQVGDGPDAGFDAEVTTWQIGPLALRRLASGPVRYHRSEALARRDCLDHWVVTIYRAGVARGTCDGAAYETDGTTPFFCGLHRPLDAHRGAAELISLFVPRDAMPEFAERMDALMGMALYSSLGVLLALHLDSLERATARMTAGEAAHAAEGTLALLRAAVTGRSDAVEAARPHFQAALRSRLLALIRREIGSVRLDPTRLARLAGLSRTRLYEVFEPEGGVARAIQRERLRAIRRALADPREARPIAALAEAFGFADPSVFSRAFRREFGITAGDFRERARVDCISGVGVRTADAPAPTDSLAGLLRRLRP